MNEKNMYLFDAELLMTLSIKFSSATAFSSSSCTVVGSTFDSDRVLKLIPEWARSVSTTICHVCYFIVPVTNYL